MRVVILAGGYGTRLGNITEAIPKPMVKIGNKPIIWHIMKIYSYYGYKEFILCLGYKAEIFKEYFYNYCIYNNDFTVEIGSNNVVTHNSHNERDWKITLVDTGLNSLKGARLKRIEKYLDDEINLLSYGDGLANVNIQKVIEFHKTHDKLITLTGVHPPSRFGELIVKNGNLESFVEKPQTSYGLISGGFMVFNRKLLEYLSTDENCDLEFGLFEKLARNKEITVFEHEGEWECVDTERDLVHLNKLWNENKAFWKIW